MDPKQEPHFADIPGLETVEYADSGAPGALHGFKVVETPAEAEADEPAPPDSNLQPPASRNGARAPGDLRTYEEPVDVASGSDDMPAQPPDLSPAEEAFDDPRHVARGTSHMASSKGSS